MNAQSPLSIVLTGGGTGGHLYPALAIADALVRDFGVPLQSLTYIGNEQSLESQKVPTRGIPFLPLVSHGMPRTKNLWRLMQWAFEMMKATAQAVRYLKALQTQVVIGTGGYVAGPVLQAAQILKIPFLVHESDTVPGLVNRLMAPKAHAVTAAFAEAQSALKVSAERFHHTGNPIDSRVGQLTKQEALSLLSSILPNSWHEEDRILLVLGGSQGAVRLNDAVFEALDALVESGWKIVHQCGTKHFKAYQNTLNLKYGTITPFQYDYVYLPFIEDMPTLWGLVDYAVCRAGSMTLSELFASRTPAVLVPYPHASQNHQEVNAQFVVRQGAGVMLKDAELNGESLFHALQDLKSQTEASSHVHDALESLAKPHASHAIVHLLLASILKKKQ
jgi:UDP-N-acetylglucosamine--N-acetylmuramyl-(pentapeptide) pyrophosphoryl-undecaprenol N-acetylglucosamine transferase